MDVTQESEQNIWKIVKETRKSFLNEHFDIVCHYENPLIPDNFIRDNTDSIEEKLKLNISSTINTNISYKTLQTAANMFTYLNYCHGTLLPHIKHLIESESTKNILLALSSIMKTSRNGYKIISNKILTRAMEMFKLNFYKGIDIIVREEASNNLGNNSKSFNETFKFLG